MQTFLSQFRVRLKPHLDMCGSARGDGFERMFAYLEGVARSEYVIVETGCVRQDAWTDGRSTVLFDEFLRIRGGTLYSIDIDPARCEFARKQVGSNTVLVNQEAVSFLYTFPSIPKVDLLYLDSYDVDWEDPHDSAVHHLKELCAVMHSLGSGSLVVVDDHVDANGRPGKSKYIVPFMQDIGAKKLFEAYQIGWILP